jgi:hypothetical protein
MVNFFQIILIVEFVEESELQKAIVKRLKTAEQCKRMLGITGEVEARISKITSELNVLKETLKIISAYSDQYYED